MGVHGPLFFATPHVQTMPTQQTPPLPSAPRTVDYYAHTALIIAAVALVVGTFGAGTGLYLGLKRGGRPT
jgi:uncharacterized protein HemX